MKLALTYCKVFSESGIIIMFLDVLVGIIVEFHLTYIEHSKKYKEITVYNDI